MFVSSMYVSPGAAIFLSLLFVLVCVFLGHFIWDRKSKCPKCGSHFGDLLIMFDPLERRVKTEEGRYETRMVVLKKRYRRCFRCGKIRLTSQKQIVKIVKPGQKTMAIRTWW